MKALTPRQRDVLAFVRSYRAREGVAPTLGEIAREFRFTVPTAFGHVKALAAKGHLRRERGRVRAIEISDPEDARPAAKVPVFGRVSQGEPVGAASRGEELDLGALFAPGRETILLRVSGDSLEPEGLRDGDFLVVDRRAKPEGGHLIFALTGGAKALVGRIYYKGERGGVIEPGGVPLSKALVQGVVVAAIRNLA